MQYLWHKQKIFNLMERRYFNKSLKPSKGLILLAIIGSGLALQMKLREIRWKLKRATGRYLLLVGMPLMMYKMTA